MEDCKEFPLLADPQSYVPDTIDLVKDDEAREYWLACVERLVEKYETFASLNREDSSVEARAKLFKTTNIEAINDIKANSLAHGQLTIRLLLDLNETCLRSQGFYDLWKHQKALENDLALTRLSQRLDEIDAIQDQREKWTELCRGIVAGNMFDWGAHAISEILEADDSFGLTEAMLRLQKRPWIIDCLDQWLDRMKGPPHKCAVVFVDNSGVDIILGVLPFIRQLLLRKTKIILCANSQPALNDITYLELVELMSRVRALCDVFHEALKCEDLLVMANGQKGPCLDLKNLDPDLCKAIKKHSVDLVIIEGMGRAVHTNLNAKISCECLKLAVIKNEWLAKRMGGPLFSVICLYEK